MAEKTKEELATELQIRDALEKAKKENDEDYAMKLVQHIVFAMCTCILLAVIGALVALVVK